VVRHYLQDVGSTFGTGAERPREWDEGWEYLYEGDSLLKRLVSMGFYIRPWQTVHYIDVEEIGRFEGDVFDPEAWRPRVPPPAILFARDDDTFWAALRVATFTDDMIQALAETARYDDPAATRLLADVLIKRRDRIVRAYLPKITPLVRFSLDETGVLTFENAAVRHGVSSSPSDGYRAAWSLFDNAAGEHRPLGLSEPSASERFPSPATLPRTNTTFVHVAVSAIDTAHPSWAVPVHVYFRRAGERWKLVGLERMP
jgi:hypothetical protein